ncbi:ABC transporter ATP-binding protein [Desulfobacterales bacterium HSG16]|nr:ABC transporter ATP-binding protein [Desulfobacterales bacterium HSG16]
MVNVENDMNTEFAVRVSHVSKCYHIYDKPINRLKQALLWNRKTYHKKFVALTDINFMVKKGDALGIIGKNGSGKSTLLQIICGTLTPSSGTVEIDGRTGALLELGSGFNPEFTGRENVFVNGAVIGLATHEIEEKFDEIAAFADIGQYLEQPVKTYSSGMLVRLAFAVQTVVEPDILIVDEALSVGDIFFAQKCAKRMQVLRENGTSLLFVSHDMASVRDLCKNAVLLYKGQALFNGPAQDAIIRYYKTDPNYIPKNEKKWEDCPKIDQIKENPKGGAEENDNHFHEMEKQAVWHCPVIDNEDRNRKKAEIIAVDIRDQDNHQTFDCILGRKLKFTVLYRVFMEDPVHIALTVKNRYDQTVFSSGSYNQRIDPPLLGIGKQAIFKMDIAMMLEGGQYTISIALGLIGAKSTLVEKLDETPQLGPLQVIWNYEEEKAPFFGMFGLPFSASFCTPDNAFLGFDVVSTDRFGDDFKSEKKCPASI